MSALVSSSWLHHMIRGSASKMRVLEASWAAKGAGHESFLEQHIPSAHFFDLWRGCTPTQERPRALHNPHSFEEYAQSLGINNDSHIVIYDKGPIFFAARLWFQFKAFGHDNVSVVDGGMIKWLQENLPVESGAVSEPETGNFKVWPSKMNQFITMDQFFRDRELMSQIVDTRRPEDFCGETEEPNFGTMMAFSNAGIKLPSKMHSGHVPRSINLCYQRLIDEDTNCFLTKEELQKVFQDVGYDPSQQVTGLCYSGMSVCMVPLAVSRLEITPGPVHVYAAGSFQVDTSLLSKYFKTFEEVSEKSYSQKSQVIDTRHANYFSGSLPEPSQATVAALLSAGMALPNSPQRGHIPGAVNLNYDALLDPTSRSLLDKDQILAVLKDKGIDPMKPTTSLCFNGIAACIFPLALSQLGKHGEAAVYQGSWTEYSQRATADMVSKTESNHGNPASGG